MTAYGHVPQCDDCGIYSHGLVLTNILFTPTHEDHKRRCPKCRVARMETQFPDCSCHNCDDLRKEVGR